MSLTGDAIYRRIHNALLKEKKKLEELLPVDLDVYALILIQARARMDMGTFGFFEKPRPAAQVMGLFLTGGSMGEKLKGINMAACAHEWTYLACAQYWLQMADVAGDMFRDSRPRTVEGMDAMTTKMALAAWKDVFAKIAVKVLNYRVSFMRLAVDSGVATAKAALAEVELAAQVAFLESEEMAETRAEYKSAYLKARMKMEAASAAAAKKAASEADSPASTGP